MVNDFLADISVPELQISGLTSTTNIIIFIISVIFALATCFFGYKLLKLWSVLIGFVIGLALGGSLANYFSGGRIWITIVVAVIVALILGVLAFFLYRVGVFILVGIETFAVAANILTSIWTTGKPGVIYIISAIIGIIIGLLAMKFIKPFVIIITGLSGGASVASALIRFIVISNNLIILIVFLAIAVAGMAVQFATTRNMKDY